MAHSTIAQSTQPTDCWVTLLYCAASHPLAALHTNYTHNCRCPPGDALIDNLSGGERRRVALCRLILSSPDILLLDEPTNHLDAESVAWLEQFLAEFKGTVVAVTHDR